MAIIFICAGGIVGMLAACVALVSGLGVLPALALWSGTGMAFAALGLTLSVMPRRNPQVARARQTA